MKKHLLAIITTLLLLFALAPFTAAGPPPRGIGRVSENSEADPWGETHSNPDNKLFKDFKYDVSAQLIYAGRNVPLFEPLILSAYYFSSQYGFIDFIKTELLGNYGKSK
jgi:hypothetical protein